MRKFRNQIFLKSISFIAAKPKTASTKPTHILITQIIPKHKNSVDPNVVLKS
jgi:hypothetical protein